MQSRLFINKRISSLYVLILLNIVSCTLKETISETPVNSGTDVIIFEHDTTPSYTAPAVSESIKVEFSSSSSWRVDVQTTKADVAWCKVEPMQGTAGKSAINIYLTDNDSELARECQVLLMSEGKILATIPVKQNGLTIEDKQKSVLLELYIATGGDNWVKNTNWNTEAPLNQWYGISTDADGFVTTINLKDNNLDGTLPKSLVELVNLKNLLLSDNNISGPIPDALLKSELWKDTWGDIIFNNNVTLAEFLDYKVPIPEEIFKEQHNISTPPAMILQWDPRKGEKTEEEYRKYLEYIDSLVSYNLGGVPIIGRCIGISEEELADSVLSIGIPWTNYVSDKYYPISTNDFPACVICDENGTIVDTNLLWDKESAPKNSSSNGKKKHLNYLDFLMYLLEQISNIINTNFPGSTPFSISLICPDVFEFPASLYSTDWSIFDRISYISPQQVNPSLIECKAVSYLSWLKFTGEQIIVSGNPSVNSRSGNIIVSLYYNGHLYDHANIRITQTGAVFSLKSQENISEFDLLEGINLSGQSGWGFTPYPSSEIINFNCNVNDVLVDQSILQGTNYREEGALPSIESTLSNGTLSSVITYSSNRSILFRGSILNYIPYVYVVTDWNDLANSIQPKAIDDGTGHVLHIPIVTIQTPVYISAEYDRYIAEPIAAENSKYPGYNQLMAYSNLSSRTIASDYVRIYSNVSWSDKDVSFSDESWQYKVVNPVSFNGDGKTIQSFDFEVYVNDYLKYKVYESYLSRDIYRPQELYPSRATSLWLNVDLHDGKAPVVVGAADVIQAGIPVFEFTTFDSSTCTAGEYYYEGKQYKFENQLSFSFKIHLDNIASYFCSDPTLVFEGENLKKSFLVSKYGSVFNGTLYSNNESGRFVTDAYFKMSTGVTVYAVKPWYIEASVYRGSSSPSFLSMNQNIIPEDKPSEKRNIPKLDSTIPLYTPENYDATLVEQSINNADFQAYRNIKTSPTIKSTISKYNKR